jgi:hypothetical protein
VRSLDLNRAYYHDCVAPVLSAHCPAIAGRHAAALVGWGSEVLGNDDEHSKKYGWGPRVVLFLTREDHASWGHEVHRILRERMPPVFRGHPTRFTDPSRGPPQPTMDPNGCLQIPIATCERFVELYMGLSRADLPDAPLSAREWLLIPEAGLLRLTAGEVYYDGVGQLSALRAYFACLPDDVWRFKLAYQWALLDQEISLIGLCAHRGDSLSARLVIARSVERIVGLVFLLNRAYKPGYAKWLHRQFYKLPHLAAEIGPLLEEAMATPACMDAVNLFYLVLDRLIAFQGERIGLPSVDYRRPAALDRGFFAYDLEPVIRALRESLQSELRALSCPVGGVDQWLIDQDLLMSPSLLAPLGSVYDWDDPVRALFDRTELDHFL